MKGADSGPTRKRRHPWFAFDRLEFYSDAVCRLNATGVGCMLALVCAEWERGHLPDDAKLLARLTATPEIVKLWPSLRICFAVDDSGKLFLPWLEDDRERSDSIAQARSEAGKIGNAIRWAEKADSGRKSDRGATTTLSQDHRQDRTGHKQDKTEQDIEKVSTPAAPSRGRGNDLTRKWDELWNREHLGEPFAWVKADAIALAQCLKLAGGDQDETFRRMEAIACDPDDWVQKNLNPRLLLKRWNGYTQTQGLSEPQRIFVQQRLDRANGHEPEQRRLGPFGEELK